MPNVIEKLTGSKANNSQDPIPTGSTNLTVVSALVAALGLIVDQFTDWTDKLLGAGASSGVKVALAIAIVGALALVFAADLLARGYASAHRDFAQAGSKTIGPAPNVSVGGVVVSIPALPHEDEAGWMIIRADGDKLLLIKNGKPAQWRRIDEVRGG